MMVRALAWGLIVILVSGCSTWHATRLAEPAPGAPSARKLPGRIRVHLANGKKVDLTHVSADGDSLRGIGSRDRRLAYALKDVRALEVGHFSAGKTVLFVLGTGLVVGGLFLLLLVIALANYSD